MCNGPRQLETLAKFWTGFSFNLHFILFGPCCWQRLMRELREVIRTDQIPRVLRALARRRFGSRAQRIHHFTVWGPDLAWKGAKEPWSPKPIRDPDWCKAGYLRKQQPLFGANVYWDICPHTFSVPEKRTLSRERSSKKTIRFEEQIMSKDKYPSLVYTTQYFSRALIG